MRGICIALSTVTIATFLFPIDASADHHQECRELPRISKIHNFPDEPTGTQDAVGFRFKICWGDSVGNVPSQGYDSCFTQKDTGTECKSPVITARWICEELGYRYPAQLEVEISKSPVVNLKRFVAKEDGAQTATGGYRVVNSTGSSAVYYVECRR